MKLMIAIAESPAVPRPASEKMLEILLGQEYNEGIPARLPATVRVAHKTGWNDRMYHDFGIIFPADRPAYALAVMTSGFEEEWQAHESVARLSQSIFDALSMG
jgi:beta-lactamase class A